MALNWEDTTDFHFQTRLEELIRDRQTSGPFKPLCQDVYKICQGFSFETLCKSYAVTSGGVFQTALHLALARVAGRCMSAAEVVSIRYEDQFVVLEISTEICITMCVFPRKGKRLIIKTLNQVYLQPQLYFRLML